MRRPRQSKVHDRLRQSERIIWRDPDSADASAFAATRGLLRILADADNSATVPRSDAGRRARWRASSAGCTSRRTRATSTDLSTWTESSAGAAIILGIGDGRSFRAALQDLIDTQALEAVDQTGRIDGALQDVMAVHSRRRLQRSAAQASGCGIPLGAQRVDQPFPASYGSAQGASS